ncbi:MAG: hypothetical protein ACRCUE_10305 [Bosea sp. (in: a-proteobacteria)]
MSPHQARLSAFDDLAAIAQSGGPGLARATLKVQTELFAQHAAESNTEFLPLALTLLPMVDEATIRDIAIKLGPLPQTPAALIEALFAHGGGVAEILIAHAPQVPPHMRQAAAEHCDPRVPARLAARGDVTEAEQLHLIGRAEPALSLTLAHNNSVILSRAAASCLISAARHDHALAGAILSRSDIDTVALTPLYASAGPLRRADIRNEIERRILERGFGRTGRDASEAEQQRLMDASLDGMPELIAEIAVITDRDTDFVSTAALDVSREIVALALVGLGLIAENTTRILLRTGDPLARDSRALHALVDIVRTTSRASAEMIIGANWPRKATRINAQHIPVMAPGGNTSRSAGATRKPSSQAIIDHVSLRS